jgi:hypothetical protein
MPAEQTGDVGIILPGYNAQPAWVRAKTRMADGQRSFVSWHRNRISEDFSPASYISRHRCDPIGIEGARSTHAGQ